MSHLSRLHKRSPLLGLVLTAIPATAMFSSHGTIEGGVDGGTHLATAARATTLTTAPAAPASPEPADDDRTVEADRPDGDPSEADERTTARDSADEPATDAAPADTQARTEGEDAPTTARSEQPQAAPAEATPAVEGGAAESGPASSAVAAVVPAAEAVPVVGPAVQELAEAAAAGAAAPVLDAVEPVTDVAEPIVDVVEASALGTAAVVPDEELDDLAGDLVLVDEVVDVVTTPAPAVEEDEAPRVVLATSWARAVAATVDSLEPQDAAERQRHVDAASDVLVDVIAAAGPDAPDLDTPDLDVLGGVLADLREEAFAVDLVAGLDWLLEASAAGHRVGCDLPAGIARLDAVRAALTDPVADAVGALSGVDVRPVDDGQLLVALVLFDLHVDCDDLLEDVASKDAATDAIDAADVVPVVEAAPVTAPSTLVVAPVADDFTARGGI